MSTQFRSKGHGKRRRTIPITPRTHQGTLTVATRIEPAGLKGINFSKGYLTEAEVNTLKVRINNKKLKPSDIPFPPDGRGFELSADQSRKGIDYLMGQWQTPSGRERPNNPFGYREQHVLENFKEFRLIDFYDSANYTQTSMGIHFYHPYYRVVAKDGSAFEYAYYGGKISIMG